MSDWVSVKDALPENNGMYLCWFSDGEIKTDYYYVGDFHWGIGDHVVTHWMLLPEPPK